MIWKSSSAAVSPAFSWPQQDLSEPSHWHKAPCAPPQPDMHQAVTSSSLQPRAAESAGSAGLETCLEVSFVTSTAPEATRWEGLIVLIISSLEMD